MEFMDKWHIINAGMFEADGANISGTVHMPIFPIMPEPPHVLPSDEHPPFIENAQIVAELDTLLAANANVTVQTTRRRLFNRDP